MKAFQTLFEKQVKRVIGLMSGTSADGVDAALVEICGHGLSTKVELIAFDSFPFEEELRGRIFNLFDPETSRVDEVCQMNFLLGEKFAEAALLIAEKAQISIDMVDLIGCHGQTIHHLPPQTGAPHVPSTLQIGEAAVIAHRTGVPTIEDFRVADVAAGGHGAPLVPYVDFLLFRQASRTIALQNIGGISNVTLIPAGASGCDVLGSDTGPGNMLIDAVTGIVTDGKQRYDTSGKIAAKGHINEALLEEWLRDSFLHLAPPKTTGREAYGSRFAKNAFEQAKAHAVTSQDLVATVTEFTARTIFEHYNRFLFSRYSIDEICVSGGGTHNITLMRRLEDLFNPIPVLTSDSHGIPSDGKEAVSFAILANEAIHNQKAGLPQVTGATEPKVLGKFTPA